MSRDLASEVGPVLCLRRSVAWGGGRGEGDLGLSLGRPRGYAGWAGRTGTFVGGPRLCGPRWAATEAGAQGPSARPPRGFALFLFFNFPFLPFRLLSLSASSLKTPVPHLGNFTLWIA